MTDESERDRRAGLAAGELAHAREDAHARGDRPAPVDQASDWTAAGRRDIPAAQRTGAAGRGGRAAGAAGGTGRDRRDDPDLLRAAIDGLLTKQGWREAAAVGSVAGRWREIVGDEVAAHTSPGKFEAGELAVTADSAAWATQVRLLAPTLVRRLNEELGHGTVTRVSVQGPVGPRQAGAWRIRSGRRRPARGDAPAP